MIEDIKFQKFCSETFRMMGLWQVAFVEASCKMLACHATAAASDDHANDDEPCSVYAMW
jgi:hypothetical protein